MSRFPADAIYRRYHRLKRLQTFRPYVDRMHQRAQAGEPEHQLRWARYLELRGQGCSLVDAFKYAESEGWQRVSDISVYGACPGCGLRARTPAGERCEECVRARP